MIKITEFYQVDKEKINKINFNNGNIKINNLFYSYDDIKDTIKDFSVVINKNEHVHLVGPSGCGKSTLCKILNGTIKNYKGLVKIDDMNIKDINYESLKENITYISQNEKIFTDTLINNITLNDSINNSKLQKILYITGLNKVLDKKELKLNTYLYGDSNNLSGGEKQRILLARALARKPKILILDESFSELDKKSELNILKKLNKFYKDTTIIYISHSNIRYFKKIIEV